LPEREATIFGAQPTNDDLVLVQCKRCSRLIKDNQFADHDVLCASAPPAAKTQQMDHVEKPAKVLKLTLGSTPSSASVGQTVIIPTVLNVQ